MDIGRQLCVIEVDQPDETAVFHPSRSGVLSSEREGSSNGIVARVGDTSDAPGMLRSSAQREAGAGGRELTRQSASASVAGLGAGPMDPPGRPVA